MKEKEYAYLVDGEYLSSKYTDIDELIESSVEDIVPQDWTVYENEFGKYVVLEVFETEDYIDTVNSNRFIKTIINDCLNDGCPTWYLEDVDKNHLKIELSKFWEKYKKDNNIARIYCAGKRIGVYKVYVEDNDMDYNFIRYERVEEESEN